MSYLELEHALQNLLQASYLDGPFYGSAGVFEQILNDDSLEPEAKALALAKHIASKTPRP